MAHKEKIIKLHKKSVKKVDEYVKAAGKLKKAEQQKLAAAKAEWDTSWNKLMETLLVLEKLEI